MKIGSRIRQLRQDSGLTLEELSKKSGMALATLSRIENEKMTGTLESHMKICKALGITLPQLYSGLEEEKKGVDVQKEKLRTDVFVHDEKYSSEMLTSKVLDKKMMPVMLKIQPDGTTDREEHKIGIERFIYILDGEIEVAIGDERYQLTKGDTLYFNASIPHRFKNTGSTEARCISIISPIAL